MLDKINLAVVGVGYWGKNVLRAFHALPDCQVVYAVDLDETRLQTVKKLYPSVQATADYEKVLGDPSVHAVAIATPSRLHFPLAKLALEAGKHTFVEKPLALHSEEARYLISLSIRQEKKLMVGHLMRYHPVVEKMKEMLDRGELGDLYYICSSRVNLGIVRQDENALWSLALHDLSIILYLLEQMPESVRAIGQNYLQPGVEDVVFLNLLFSDGKMAQVHASWLDPRKERKMTLVGNKKMIVFDDTEAVEKLRIYDKGVDRAREFGSYAEFLTLRNGDIHIPHLQMEEPLKRECQHFVDCIEKDLVPLTDGQDGLRVVRVLEMAQESLDKGGIPITICRR